LLCCCCCCFCFFLQVISQVPALGEVVVGSLADIPQLERFPPQLPSFWLLLLLLLLVFLLFPAGHQPGACAG
jgi:hypothetical protein